MLVLSMITKDAAEKHGAVFVKVLESSLQVPYEKIILVDDSTTDKTRMVVKKFADEHGKELIVSPSRLPPGWDKPTRATARQTAIDIFLENFGDEWLMFLDDDAVLRDGWWEWIILNKILEAPDVGEIWGINWDADDTRRRYLEAFGINFMQYLLDAFRRRGGTHDTMYRRKAIAGVKIPPWLHLYEDAWLHHYVFCRGWKSVINPVGVLHHHVDDPADFNKERWLFAIKVAVKYGITEFDMPRSRIRAYISLMRPIAGWPFMFATLAKLHGWRRALPASIIRQYRKLWVRWQSIKELSRNGWRIPDVCEAIKSYVSS